jgi:Flp pilus assembly protein TadG
MRWFRRRRRGERGQALVELAVLTPILVLLLAGIVEVGDAFNAHMSVVNASRDGARLIAKGGATDAQVVSGENAVSVQACHNHKLIINYPLLPLPNPIHLCATTTMRVLKTG